MEVLWKAFGSPMAVLWKPCRMFSTKVVMNTRNSHCGSSEESGKEKVQQ